MAVPSDCIAVCAFDNVPSTALPNATATPAKAVIGWGAFVDESEFREKSAVSVEVWPDGIDEGLAVWLSTTQGVKSPVPAARSHGAPPGPPLHPHQFFSRTGAPFAPKTPLPDPVAVLPTMRFRRIESVPTVGLIVESRNSTAPPSVGEVFPENVLPVIVTAPSVLMEIAPPSSGTPAAVVTLWFPVNELAVTVTDFVGSVLT